MKVIKPGVHVVLQRGKYAGKGGDVVQYVGDERYHLRLRWYGKEKEVIAPRSVFMTHLELVGDMIRRIRVWHSRTKKRENAKNEQSGGETQRPKAPTSREVNANGSAERSREKLSRSKSSVTGTRKRSREQSRRGGSQNQKGSSAGSKRKSRS